ncbi:molybdenum ABC transporter [Escherichia phage vB_EcoM_ESCO47]|nr:molybdenum ABC transporter [Escherichia phage vB_EcoM_ESCO47]
MDLMSMFDEPEVEAPKAQRGELVDELDIIIQRHGFNLPIEVLKDLASYYDDPPPWAPWS